MMLLLCNKCNHPTESCDAIGRYCPVCCQLVFSHQYRSVSISQRDYDAIILVVKLGGATFGLALEQLGDMIKKARETGITLKEVARAAAMITRSGVSIEKAVTRIN